MRNKNPYRRAMATAAFVAALSFWNYSRLVGSDCIRAIHIVTLLTCGAGIGIFLMNLLMLLRNKDEPKNDNNQ